MTLEKIHRKVQELHAKTRKELMRNIAVPFFTAAVAGAAMIQTKDPFPRWMFACTIVWALVGQYALNRGMWTATMPGDAALNTGIEFYRLEIERRRSFFKRLLWWSFGPLVLLIGAIVLLIMSLSGMGTRALPRMMPFLVLVGAWLVSLAVVRIRARLELQREIEELDRIERETGGKAPM